LDDLATSKSHEPKDKVSFRLFKRIFRKQVLSVGTPFFNPQLTALYRQMSYWYWTTSIWSKMALHWSFY